MAVPAAIFGFLVLVPLVAHFGLQSYVLSLATQMVVLALAAMSLDILIGYCGLVSFGHAAFVGIGAYSVGILSHYGYTDLFAHLAAAVAVAIVFALVSGAVSLRTQGAYFIMSTLAFAQMLFFFATSLSSFGGDDGMSIAARSTVFGTAALHDDSLFFYVALACLGAVFLCLRRLVASRFGRVLRGTRDNELRMNAIGFAPGPFRLVAYVVSGAAAAVAGVMFANATEFISPAAFSWQRSGELVLMVVLGGVGSLHGAILGAIAYVLIEEGLSHLMENWQVAFGPILILAVLFLRGGLTRQIERAASST